MHSSMVQDSYVYQEIRIVGSVFDTCTASSDCVLRMPCQSLLLSGNSMTNVTSLTTESPVIAVLTAGTTKIEGTAFESSSSLPLLDITCEEGAQLEFFNCCFTHGTQEQTGPQFMKLVVHGSAVLSYLCFDTDKDTAMSVTGNGKVDYQHTLFQDCVCWDVPPPSSETTAEPTGTNTPTDLPTYTTTEDTGDGQASGSNTGLIVGLVVGLLLLIAIVIIIVLVILCRKSRSSTGQDNGNEEFTEETITTLGDEQTNDGGDWGHTQDNPLFASENYQTGDDDAYANAFEEQGFFTSP